MLTIWRDLRYSARMLRKNPGFTAVAIATLALCFGANLTIFAVVDSVLLRPLPFPESDRLVTLFNSYPRAGRDRDFTSLTSYYERQGNIPAFSHLAALTESTTIVGESGSTERVAVGARHDGLFRHAGHRASQGPGVYRVRNDLSDRPGSDPHRRVLAAVFQRGPECPRARGPPGWLATKNRRRLAAWV